MTMAAPEDFVASTVAVAPQPTNTRSSHKTCSQPSASVSAILVQHHPATSCMQDATYAKSTTTMTAMVTFSPDDEGAAAAITAKDAMEDAPTTAPPRPQPLSSTSDGTMTTTMAPATSSSAVAAELANYSAAPQKQPQAKQPDRRALGSMGIAGAGAGQAKVATATAGHQAAAAATATSGGTINTTTSMNSNNNTSMGQQHQQPPTMKQMNHQQQQHQQQNQLERVNQQQQVGDIQSDNDNNNNNNDVGISNRNSNSVQSAIQGQSTKVQLMQSDDARGGSCSFERSNDQSSADCSTSTTTTASASSCLETDITRNQSAQAQLVNSQKQYNSTDTRGSFVMTNGQTTAGSSSTSGLSEDTNNNDIMKKNHSSAQSQQEQRLMYSQKQNSIKQKEAVVGTHQTASSTGSSSPTLLDTSTGHQSSSSSSIIIMQQQHDQHYTMASSLELSSGKGSKGGGSKNNSQGSATTTTAAKAPPSQKEDGSSISGYESPAPQAAPQAKPDRRAGMMKSSLAVSHRSFFQNYSAHTLQRSYAKRGLFSEEVAEEEGEDENDNENDNDNEDNDNEVQSESDHYEQENHHLQRPSSFGLRDTLSKTKRFFSSLHLLKESSNPTLLDRDHLDIHEEEEEEEIVEQPAHYYQEPPPESEVERIVQRLERRNANRVSVTADVKSRFLRLCKEACRERKRIISLDSNISDGDDDGLDDSHISRQSNTNKNGLKGEEKIISSACILRSDVIQIRQDIRFQFEGRSKSQRIRDSTKAYFGFRCHCEVLLNVLNRAVDLIDESGKMTQKKGKSKRGDRMSSRSRRRLGSSTTSSVGSTVVGMSERNNMLDNNSINFGQGENIIDNNNSDDKEEEEWFYYKDFAFYNLKLESNYPWMRNAGVFSILTTVAFYFFAPILWCTILNDPNICPQTTNGDDDDGKVNGWLSALFFASATMSTVGYGDVSVFVGSDDDIDTPEPETWRIFIAILFMISSLVVSVVGFQAGLDSQFHFFRRRLDIFGHKVYDILKDAHVVKIHDDKHDDILSRMRWSRFSQLAEISLIFLILNLVGVFALQLSLLGEEEDEFGSDGGEKLSVSWMESLYWAVQTTTTIGYGDVTTPESLRWFLLLYLAISTYFVGSAFGKLGELSEKLESMQRLYLWQQQEASYTMLHDFSGRPDRQDSGNNEAIGKVVDYEPEIDQFEFTIASLVVMGKITSADVRPILEKFQRLKGDSNKITASDVSGPMKKKEDVLEVKENEPENEESGMNVTPAFSRRGSLSVGKKIAKAFREEILASSVLNIDNDDAIEEEEMPEDFSDFCIPKNTKAIAIDDSKIQRKLLGKFFSFAGIPPDDCTVVGDGHDEIMGFEDYVVKFVENHDGYVFMIVDENLDIVDESSKPSTISGSLCVQNIRGRLSEEAEKRMFALIRSANDSSSDITMYNSRAHGFLPKAPIKRDKINEVLAPLWRKRFPLSEFGETLGNHSRSNEAVSASDDIACTPYDIAQKVIGIESLFKKNVHLTKSHLIHDELHELKGDLLTLNSGKLELSVTSVVDQINVIQDTKSPETLLDRWQTLRDHINDIIQSLQKHIEKNFRIPAGTKAIAIDDSRIQRKLLAKFFDFLDISREDCVITGESSSEIRGFEDFAVDFMHNHKDNYVFMIVDENLDVADECCISGSECIQNIRKRLPEELERRMLAIVRSANDSRSDIAIYNKRAHGFLPKAPIRREKVNETIAPLWLKRFPISEFGDSAVFDSTDETVSIASEELACTPYDIAQKLIDIDSLFKKNAHVTDTRIIADQLHELKGDLLTLKSDSSMISILGMINLMLLGHDQSPESVIYKWHALRDRVYSVINPTHISSSNSGEGQSATLSIFKRTPKNKDSTLLNRPISSEVPFPLSSSFLKENSSSSSAVRY